MLKDKRNSTLESSESENEERINIIILGNSEVGKTCFILRYTENKFQSVYLATIGTDFKVKTVKIKNKQYNLFFYDTTGQEKFRSIPLNSIKNAHGIILMYDITNKTSFESIPNWIKSIEDEKGKDFPLIILGNKIDKNEERVISEEEGIKLANEYGIEFYEISNKENINVNESGMALINKILLRQKEDSDYNSSRTSHKLHRMRTGEQDNSSKCC